MTRLIGLTGAAGAGKDTVAGIIADTIGAQTIAFADPLRAMLGELLAFWGEDPAVMTCRRRKELPVESIGVSPRRMLQTLGTEWGRQLIHPELWTATAGQRVRLAQRLGANVVITDVRFENEAHLIHRLGGVVWKIDRPGIEAVAAHASEAGLPAETVDRVIDNSGTLADLSRAVEFELRQQPLFGGVAA